MTTYEEIITAIATGKLDDSLSDFSDQIHARQHILKNKLRPGDTVQFLSGANPKYLQGLEATVVKINRSTIVVACPQDERYGRFSGSRQLRCPRDIVGAV